MLELSDLVWLGLIAAAVMYWWRARGFKSLALHLASQRCRLLEVQLLDQSVEMKKIRFQRGSNGVLQLRRIYGFEFSSTGIDRYRGILVLDGARLHSIEMEPHVVRSDSGTVIEQ